MLSPNDGSTDYGTWDKGSFGPQPKTEDMLPREYAREAIFDAMRRKEVYATTGTRITVRVFAGWNFEPSDIHLCGQPALSVPGLSVAAAAESGTGV